MMDSWWGCLLFSMALLNPPGSELTHAIIGSAIQVHRQLGPGLLESAYITCLLHELDKQHIKAEREVPVPLMYQGLQLGLGYRLDLLVGDQVIVEVKAVGALDRIHRAQLMTYLKLMKLKTGLLINFNVPELRQGIRRVLL